MCVSESHGLEPQQITYSISWGKWVTLIYLQKTVVYTSEMWHARHTSSSTGRFWVLLPVTGYKWHSNLLGCYLLENHSQSPVSQDAWPRYLHSGELWGSFSLHLSEATCPRSLAFFWESDHSQASLGGLAFSASMFPNNLGLHVASTQDLTLYDLLTPESNVTLHWSCSSKHVFNSLLGLNFLNYENWEHHFTDIKIKQNDNTYRV